MILELSLSDLYTELLEDPDLRRLGKYRLIAESRQTIFPIDIDFGDKDVHLGDGDFRDGFVAFCESRAKSIDLGTSVFTDLYMDFIEAETCLLSGSKASRLYFDDAKFKDCRFGNFEAPEVYFDRAIIDTVASEGLRAGIIYPEKLDTQDFDPETLSPNAHRIALEHDTAKRILVDVLDKNEGSDEEIRLISPSDFLRYLAEGVELNTLGSYKIIPEGDGILSIDLDLEGREINFGNGDFTSVRVVLGNTKAQLVDFGESMFSRLDFQAARIESCFFAHSQGQEVHFGDSEIKNVFWERGRADGVYLDNLVSGQFNINSMETAELRLGASRIREMYLSVGEGVERMFCEHAQLELLNLHEGRLQEVDFGESRIYKALINKARIEVVRAEGLIADKLYVGNDGKNEIGELRLGLNPNIGEVDLEKALFKDGREVERSIIKGFGPL